jgi:hypothetical protein
MTNYTYIINVQNNYGYICESETTNWQEAIDLFQHGKTMGKTCFMLTCQIVVKDESTNALNYLTDMQDIQWWSEHLINLRYNEESEADEEEEMFKNRILGRIAQEADGMEVVEPRESHGEFMTRSHKEADQPKAEVKRENNTDIAEYRVFNVSMREMQIQTSDFEKAFEVWREGEKYTGERWTLLVMPPLNGKKLYLQDNAVHEYRTDKLMKDTTVYQDVGMATPDFHGEFSDMEAALQEAIINPKHYKLFSPEDYSAYPNGIEYMDLCDKALAHLSGVEAHLVGQILKYTLRVGKKDAMEQDAKKIEWYATRLVNTVKGG